MLRKSNVLAIAASLALGLTMLSPTAASAHGGHGGGHGGGGGHWGGGGYGGGHHWHVGHYHPVWVARPVVYTAVRPVVSAPGPCTCLSKEYTPEGAVLFKDRCTNEAAMNPPVIAPQQSGSIDAPTQQAANSPQYQATPANALPQVDLTTGLPK
jgi:hypothetical protein